MLNIPMQPTIPQMPVVPIIPNTFQYIGGIQNLETTARQGDIAHYMDNTYVYMSDEWLPLFDDSLEPSRVEYEHIAYPKICSQCGAPLFSCQCEYCGTMYG